MRLLLIDNYDSFVHNLAQAFGALGAEPVVVRNDSSADDLRAVDPAGVVISPGPGGPADAGISMEAVDVFAGVVPLLGVCLGHQCIAAAYGGSVNRAAAGPVHGKTSQVHHGGSGIFSGLPSPFLATRYHSLAIDPADPPEGLVVDARSEDETIMAVRDPDRPVFGVQFHPESVLCDEGPRLLANFLSVVAARGE